MIDNLTREETLLDDRRRSIVVLATSAFLLCIPMNGVHWLLPVRWLHLFQLLFSPPTPFLNFVGSWESPFFRVDVTNGRSIIDELTRGRNCYRYSWRRNSWGLRAHREDALKVGCKWHTTGPCELRLGYINWMSRTELEDQYAVTSMTRTRVLGSMFPIVALVRGVYRYEQC